MNRSHSVTCLSGYEAVYRIPDSKPTDEVLASADTCNTISLSTNQSNEYIMRLMTLLVSFLNTNMIFM